MAPEREIKYRPALPTVLLSLDSTNPHDELMRGKTVLTVRKHGKQSSHSIHHPKKTPSLKHGQTEEISSLNFG